MPKIGEKSNWHFVDDNDLGSRQFYAVVISVAHADVQILDQDAGCTVIVYDSHNSHEPTAGWQHDDPNAYKRLTLPLTTRQFNLTVGWHYCI